MRKQTTLEQSQTMTEINKLELIVKCKGKGLLLIPDLASSEDDINMHLISTLCLHLM